MTIAQSRDDLTALLSAAQGLTDEVQALFAANGDGGKRIVADTNTLLGAAVYEPNALPQALSALNNLAAKSSRCSPVSTGTRSSTSA